MSYALLSEIYDELMQDVPYEVWTQFFVKMCQTYGTNFPEKLAVLDLGCGTGRFILELVQKGHHPVGIDVSEEMLAVAAKRMETNHMFVPLFHQSMDCFVLFKSFDVVTVFCDSLNYLLDEKSVFHTFRQIYQHLKPKGLLLFDVHTPYKFDTEFHDETYSVLETDYVVIWNTFLNREMWQVRHELTYFMDISKNGIYERFEEQQIQRTFVQDVYTSLLERAGFTLLTICDEQMQPIQSNSLRWFFCAQKPNK